MSEQVVSAACVAIEDMTKFKPTITEVLSEIFSAYTFSFGGEKMTPYEVFSGNGFLPVLSHLSCLRMNDLFGIPFEVETAESDDAILGVEVNPQFRSTSSVMLYLIATMLVSQEIFGLIPSDIDLDDLYSWSMDEELQQKGLPYLGMKS